MTYFIEIAIVQSSTHFIVFGAHTRPRFLMARNEREPAAPGAVDPEISWNESQWFWWSDPDQRISGFHRIAHQPNRNNAHIWNAIIDDTGRYTRRVSSEVAL